MNIANATLSSYKKKKKNCKLHYVRNTKPFLPIKNLKFSLSKDMKQIKFSDGTFHIEGSFSFLSCLASCFRIPLMCYSCCKSIVSSSGKE